MRARTRGAALVIQAPATASERREAALAGHLAGLGAPLTLRLHHVLGAADPVRVHVSSFGATKKVMGRRVKMGNTKTAIGYLRVSTAEQQLGPKAQAAALDAWTAREGVTLVAVFLDQGVSGAAPVADRPGLLTALAALRGNNAGVLAVAKRDRIARDVVIAASVERAAASAGARVVSADGMSDRAGPEGAMMRGIVDVFAEYERGVIRARTAAALAAKKARGERVGSVAFGYRLAADGVRIEPNEQEQAVIARIRSLRASGLSTRGVVAALALGGVTSPRSGRPLAQTQVQRVLNRARDEVAA